MGSPFDNDDHLLLITLAVTVVFQLAFFFVAFACKFDKVGSRIVNATLVWVPSLCFCPHASSYSSKQERTTAAVLSVPQSTWNSRSFAWNSRQGHSLVSCSEGDEATYAAGWVDSCCCCWKRPWWLFSLQHDISVNNILMTQQTSIWNLP